MMRKSVLAVALVFAATSSDAAAPAQAAPRGAGKAKSQAHAHALDANAREVRSRFDPRIRIVEFNPLDVVTIQGVFGYSTNIQFAPDETVTDVAAGDSLAWEFQPRGNHLFVKPREPNGRTNAAILTNLRVYQMVFDSRPRELAKDEDMELFVIFRYEDDPAKAAEATQVNTEVAAAREALERPSEVMNTAYEKCRRNRKINPAEAWDDGRFTHFRFGEGQALPVALAVQPDGKLASVNFTMFDERTMVIFETAPKFVLRIGKTESCIVNRGFGKGAASVRTGATVRGVVRTMGEAAK